MSEFLMNAYEADQWLRANWKPLHQAIEDIRARAVEYGIPVNGYLTNMGPVEAGVYFLFDDEELVYVGKATTISNRLRAHWEGQSFYWRYVSWIECPQECAEEVEHFYIRELKPFFNVRILPSRGRLMAELVKG